MQDRSYIKLFRKLLTWEWYSDTPTTRVFLHILLKAQYEPTRFKGYSIERGECVMGYRAWAKALGLSVQQVRTAIKHLNSTHEITLKPTRHFTIVHVEKWDYWQLEEFRATRKPTQEPTNDQHTPNTRLTQSKESKKVRNKEIIIDNSRPKANSLEGWTLEEKLKAFRGEA